LAAPSALSARSSLGYACRPGDEVTGKGRAAGAMTGRRADPARPFAKG
jgi:hypothetical protein